MRQMLPVALLVLSVVTSRGFTASAPRLVRDLSLGSADPSYLIPVGKYVYFTSDGTWTGSWLARSDGTVSGTQYLVQAGGRLQEAGGKIWSAAEEVTSYDPATNLASTFDIEPDEVCTMHCPPYGSCCQSSGVGSLPRALKNFSGKLACLASRDRYTGLYLEPDFSTPLANFYNDGVPMAGTSEDMALVNGRLFFGGGVNNSTELWSSLGTPATTLFLKQIHPSPGSSDPHNFIGVNGMCYFNADDGSHGRELWRSDGTPQGTYLVKDLTAGVEESDPQDLVEWNHKLCFTARGHYDYPLYPQYVYVSDGTASGTQIVAEGDGLGNLTAGGDDLYFTAFSSEGYELWRTDGTLSGTRRLVVRATGPDYTPTLYTAWFDNHLYFDFTDLEHGSELWQSDGTEEGTTIVQDLLPGPQGSQPAFLTIAANHMFFAAHGTAGLGSDPSRELWAIETPADSGVIGSFTAVAPLACKEGPKGSKCNSSATFRVTNEGSSAMGAFTVSFFASPDDRLSSDDVPLGHWNIRKLNAAQSRLKRVKVRLTAGATTATLHLLANIKLPGSSGNTNDSNLVEVEIR